MERKPVAISKAQLRAIRDLKVACAWHAGLLANGHTDTGMQDWWNRPDGKGEPPVKGPPHRA